MKNANEIKRIIESVINESVISKYNNGEIIINIYLNPTSDDISQLQKDVDKISERRTGTHVYFVADADSKKVYLWVNIIPPQSALRDQGYSVADIWGKPNVFFGGANIDHNAASVMSYDSLSSMFGRLDIQIGKLVDYDKNEPEYVKAKAFVTTFFKYDWSFVDRYVNGFSTLLNKYKSGKQSIISKL